MCVHFVQSKKSDSSFTSEPTKRWHYCHTIQIRSWWNLSSSVAQAWWPVFKYYHLFSSYSVFISSCLGRILPSKLSIVPFVHKGIAITPTIFNNSLKFTYSERIVDSVMILLVLHFSIPIHLILHRGLNVNLPMLIENYMPLRGCCCSVDSNTKLLFFTQTPCIFFFSPRRWLRGLQSTPPRLPSALFGC